RNNSQINPRRISQKKTAQTKSHGELCSQQISVPSEKIGKRNQQEPPQQRPGKIFPPLFQGSLELDKGDPSTRQQNINPKKGVHQLNLPVHQHVPRQKTRHRRQNHDKDNQPFQNRERKDSDDQRPK